jgi:hypothetical protein
MIGPKFRIFIWYRPNLDGRGQLFPEPCVSVAPISKLKLTDIDHYDDALEAMFGAERLKNMRAEALNGYIKDVWCYAAAFPGVRTKFEMASRPTSSTRDSRATGIQIPKLGALENHWRRHEVARLCKRKGSRW